MNTNLEFDNEIKQLAQGVYQGNEKYIPLNWLNLSEYENKKTGFYGQAFYQNGKIVLSFRGTEFENFKDLNNDKQMTLNHLPEQYFDAQNFYEQIKKDFPNQPIIFTGHSLGGSLAQLMGNQTGCETITFNAYGVGDLIPEYKINSDNMIRNYGNINDFVFNSNLKNQIGEIYITGADKNTEHITEDSRIDYKRGFHPAQYHSIENMGNLEGAVEYRKEFESTNQTSFIQEVIRKINNFKNNNFENKLNDINNKLNGYISKDNFVEYIKEILKKTTGFAANSEHIFTQEEIDKMSLKEFEQQESKIMQQLKEKGIPSDQELKEYRTKHQQSENGHWVTIDGRHVFIED